MIGSTSILLLAKLSHIVTNALLFIDVLAFRQYLIHGTIPENILKKLKKQYLVSLVSLALKTKSQKTNYDDLLIKLLKHLFDIVNSQK
jgi:hypothetical protein